MDTETTTTTRRWLPKGQYFATLPQEELVKRLLKKSRKRKRAPRRYKRRIRRRVGYSRYSKGGGYGTNIIYPNVIGRGPYSLKGDLSWGNPDSYFRGHIGGALADTIQGMGPYVVKKNSLMSAIDLGQDPPRVANTNLGEATVVCHREYLGDLISGTITSGGTNFKLDSYSLNPGNSSLFPFLASIATNFQEYELRGCLIELKSLSSEYSAQLGLGSVFMSADYNVYGNTPSSKQQVENMEYASSAKPSKSLIMPIECEPQNNGIVHKNVAIDGQYAGGDRRLYDWCNIFIGSQGIPEADTPIAEIWITYEIALFKPILANNNPAPNAGYWNIGIWHGYEVTTDQPFGLAKDGGSDREGLKLDYVGTAPGTPQEKVRLSLPRQLTGGKNLHFKIDYWWCSAAELTNDNHLPTLAYTNCSVEYILPDNTGGFGAGAVVSGWEAQRSEGALKVFSLSLIVRVTPGNEPAYIDFTGGIKYYPSETVNAMLLVTALPFDFW